MRPATPGTAAAPSGRTARKAAASSETERQTLVRRHSDRQILDAWALPHQMVLCTLQNDSAAWLDCRVGVLWASQHLQ